MYCPHCKRDLPDGVQACDSCGGPAVVYGPPEGFLWDAESSLYYRDEAYTPGDTERWVTWFHPNAGDYKQVSYPVETGEAPEPPTAPPTSGYYDNQPDFTQKKSGSKKRAIILPLAVVMLFGLAVGGHFLALYQLPLLPEVGEGADAAPASGPAGTPILTAAPSPTITRETPVAPSAPTPYPLPERLSLAQLDPYDMLHIGMTLTEEQAASQFGITAENTLPTFVAGELTPTLPGAQSGRIGAALEYIYRNRDFEDFHYTYYLDETMSRVDAVRLFRLAVAAMDEAFSGRNKLWGDDLREAGISVDFASDQEIEEFYTGSNQIICYWGVSLGGAWYERPCVASVELVPGGFSASEIKVRFWYSFDLFTRKEYLQYFPDENAAEIPASPTSFPAPAAAEEQAAEREAAGQEAIDTVRIGTYGNDDVYGVGLEWYITFHADHTFDFIYGHEEGEEHFTGNWHSENGGSRVVLHITGGVSAFTTSLYVDGHKYVIFESDDFDHMSLPFIG